MLAIFDVPLEDQLLGSDAQCLILNVCSHHDAAAVVMSRVCDGAQDISCPSMMGEQQEHAAVAAAKRLQASAEGVAVLQLHSSCRLQQFHAEYSVPLVVT